MNQGKEWADAPVFSSFLCPTISHAMSPLSAGSSAIVFAHPICSGSSSQSDSSHQWMPESAPGIERWNIHRKTKKLPAKITSDIRHFASWTADNIQLAQLAESQAETHRKRKPCIFLSASGTGLTNPYSTNCIPKSLQTVSHRTLVFCT